MISLDSAETDPVSFSDSTNKSPLQATPISTPPIISYQPSQKQEEEEAQSKTLQTEEGVKPVELVEGGLFTVTQKQLEEENMRLREEISYLSSEVRNNKIKNNERGKGKRVRERERGKGKIIMLMILFSFCFSS